MVGPNFWRAPATRLKKCSEFTLNADCPKTVFDDCCAVVACDYCLEFDVYGETLRTGIASFNGTEYSGSIAGAAFLLWVQRNYDTNECESVATLDGEEIDVLTCYDGMSCRNLSGSAEVTIYPDTGTLTWTKIEPKPLEHITDPDTNCKTWFCDSCECTCDCLCVTITDSYDTVTEGEICDTTYDCDTPIWEGTVGDYELSIALGRDDYGNCVITATVDGEEQAAVLAPGCGEMASTITLADGTTIAVECQRCGCNPDVGDCPCCPGWPQAASGIINWATTVAVSNDCELAPSLVEVSSDFGCPNTEDVTGTLLRQAETSLWVRVFCDTETLIWKVQYRSATTGGGFDPPASATWLDVSAEVVCPNCADAIGGIATGTIDFTAVMACEISGPTVVEYDIIVHGDIEIACL